MNHYVPDFETEDDYSIPPSSGLARHKKPPMPEDEIMELLWQNGQVVMQSQNQRSLKKSTPSRYPIEDAVIPPEQSAGREIRSSSAAAGAAEEVSASHLFMQEDEMASWLHYPLDDSSFDHDFCADLLYPAPCVTNNTPPVRTSPVQENRPTVSSSTVAAARPPIPPMRRTEVDSRFQNFVHFSRMKARAESGPSDSSKAVRETTVVDSSDTPAVGQESRASQVARSTAEVGNVGFRGCGSMSGDAVAGTSYGGGGGGGGRELLTCDMTVTSSPGGSGASVSAGAEPVQKQLAEDRKRKVREADETECHSEVSE